MSITQIHGLEKKGRYQIFEMVGKLFKLQGLLEECFIEPTLDKDVIVGRFALGFEIRLWIDNEQKFVTVVAGNHKLGIDATYTYQIKYKDIRMDSVENTAVDLELIEVFSKVMKKANFGNLQRQKLQG